jgi:outer membrane immunogenic protein
MRTLLLRNLLATGTALVGLAALSLDAQAADMQMRPTSMAAPAFSWTGFYFGGNGGCAWHDTPAPTNFATDLAETDTFVFNNEKASGCFTGLQLGYNYQTGPWVWGLEGDIQLGKISSFNQAAALTGGGGTELEAAWESKISSFGTVRGKLGYAFNGPLPLLGGLSWMPYFTGGYAWARNQLTFRSEDLLSSTQTQTHGGYAIGAGLAYAMTQNLQWTAEYLFLGLDSKTYNVIIDQDIGVPAGANYGRLNVNLFRTGLNWRF